MATAAAEAPVKKDPEAQPIHKIFVGYRLKPATYLDSLLPTAPATEDEKTKLAYDQEVDKIRTAANDGDRVYLSTFDEVHLNIPTLGQSVTYKSAGRNPGESKPAICLAVRAWLLKYFPKAWGTDMLPGPGRKPEAIFVGFDPRLFLKILGLECSLPLYDKPVPPGMWFGNSDHRDIEEAVRPKTESKGITWDMIIRARRLGLSGDGATRYDKAFAGWEGPGKSPEQDATIAMILAIQLGFLPPSEK